ncbi:phage portal protein [Rhodoblastus acidophilus]|nr:phage portal protein [Rhodoblastus acidophilus]
MTWTLRAKPGRDADAENIARAETFFESPDGVHDWSAWLRMILEDLFVIDAPALWCERDRAGNLLALHPLDGATIKPVLDFWGRTPRPFMQDGQKVYPVAYQQILKGLPAVDYTTRDIIYRPRNLRSHRAYGFSPVEQIVATVNIGLKRQLHQLNYYTEGNIPESLIGVPDSWTPDQIKNFQDYWDLYFDGDLARRRRAKFVPGGVAKTFIQTKEPELKSAFDEWIARVVCFAFSVSPQPFINQMNRSTSETQSQMSNEEGLQPILAWIKRLCDAILIQLGAPNLEFAWRNETVVDPTVQRENLVALVNAGMMTRRRAAQIMGEILPDDPMADVLAITTGQGVAKLQQNRSANDEKKVFTQEVFAGALDKYSDDQPRDDRGRWSNGGNFGETPNAKPGKGKSAPNRSPQSDNSTNRPGAHLENAATHVNPKNDQQNCGFVIDAVAARLRGTDRSAVAQSGREGAWDEIESRFNMKITWGQKIDDAYSQVKQAGDGALAIVGIRYPDGAGAHVVVIGNDRGKVGIVEAQDWGNG